MRGRPNNKFSSLGQRLKELLPESVESYLLVQYSDSLPTKEVWRSDDTTSGVSGDGKRLLGVCAKRQRTVIVHDAEKDTLMRGIKVRSFSSALCVPIFSEDKTLLGTLLLVSKSVGTFTKDHRYAVERFSRDYSAPLESIRATPKRDDSNDNKPPATFTNPFMLAGAILVVVVFGLWMGAPVEKLRYIETEARIVQVNTESRDRATSFLGFLREGDHNAAWESLSPELQSRWPQTEFDSQMANWSEFSTHQEALEARTISTFKRNGRKAQVVLRESRVQNDNGIWSWELEKLDGEWVVTSMKGPVDSPANTEKS